MARGFRLIRATRFRLKAGLEKESDVVIISAQISTAPRSRISSASAQNFPATPFLALGDYANSRGAADMGILPDRLPGYRALADSAERARFSKRWGSPKSHRRGHDRVAQ